MEKYYRSTKEEMEKIGERLFQAYLGLYICERSKGIRTNGTVVLKLINIATQFRN